MILNDDECRTVYNDAMELPGRSAVSVTRAVEAAVIKRLAAGVSVEPHEYVWNPDGTFNIGQERCLSSNTGPCHGWEIYPIYSDDELTTAIAAARAQALEEAAKVCENLVIQYVGNSSGTADQCAAEIRSLAP